MWRSSYGSYYVASKIRIGARANLYGPQMWEGNIPIVRVYKGKGFTEEDAKHREKYPSLMEKQMKEGTFNGKGEGMRKKEPMKYTGDLIQGIATMHKSNAVPVIN